MENLVIYGAGGFAREVLWLVEEINKKSLKWNVLGFVDDNQENWGKILNGKEILGGREFLNSLSSEIYIIIAIGNGETREKIVNDLGERRYATLIHPEITCDKTISIGEGSIICKGTIITVNISIGKHIIINLDCSIGHDVIIENYVTIFPSVNISGGVNIRKCSSIGTSTVVLQYLNIGSYTTIGSLSNIIKDIPSHCVAVGNPARVIKNRGENNV
ncbi:putative acetyltransferase EpsM [Fusobacterium necrophorum]|uniref:acetyltransferase n=1 Tax=Fusobacterium necrophorum TaxID=859 RepID=UPI0004616A35|nr:acetyltransferase [Fusobacterium necrophorum]KDE61885.1 transferase [Fusobacterium necrophorum BFTR-1]MBR8734797.1 putative acetyltransferase EpsM [Fusobacterium necrophorum]MBR8790965.1 putative acetyltransferase EpsM [Fusobacterium necrophorum]MCF0161640.1 acetyltransferase [Fusobacterium necrophorum]